jgi:hypothetical protein
MNTRKTRLLAAWLMGARRHQILLVVLLESFLQTFIVRSRVWAQLGVSVDRTARDPLVGK